MRLSFIGVNNIPMVEPGDDLVTLILSALEDMGENIQDDDVLVLAQKIVSKAENRYLDLRDVEVGEQARALALEVDKEPRKVQAILNESAAVVRKRPGVLIVEHKLGFVHANAGIDQSNIPGAADDPDAICLMLPLDSDASAQENVEAILERCGKKIAVIINDSIGRAWRNGSLGLAIGVAGMTALEDHIGEQDLFGRDLVVTQVGAADEMAAGASLVMGQTVEKTPVVLVRGFNPVEPEDPASRGVQPLIRPREMDMFR